MYNDYQQQNTTNVVKLVAGFAIGLIVAVIATWVLFGLETVGVMITTVLSVVFFLACPYFWYTLIKDRDSFSDTGAGAKAFFVVITILIWFASLSFLLNLIGLVK